MWRLVLGLALIGVAVALTMLSCRWGTDLDTERVLMVPGVSPPQGLYAATWTGANPFLAMFLGIVLPVLLVTVATWVLVRLRSTNSAD